MQKTAYEMRISEWSSDVCSSDRQFAVAEPVGPAVIRAADGVRELLDALRQLHAAMRAAIAKRAHLTLLVAHQHDVYCADPDRRRILADLRRSEEHTSELQSLMRISYAVFCLKKKKKKDKKQQRDTSKL